MAAAYFENGVGDRATFELFIRHLPKSRNYLIAAGLEQSLEYLEHLRFSAGEIDYLKLHPSFKHVSHEFFNYLREFRFSGDVWAVAEGTAVFASEPLLRVTAPIIEAQVVETVLLAHVNFQTLVASKAARLVTAAQGRDVVEFGTRRAHGPQAGLLAARSAYIGGCVGTSNCEAGLRFGIPTFGTLAHSFIMSFDDEDEALRAFMRVFPDSATVLLDTYDTIAAAQRLAEDSDAVIPAVRLDSGDLAELSVEVRRIFDAAGKTGTRIFASGDLNEYKIAELIAHGARIDAFGVGTELATSYDAAALPGVYKLVATEADGRVAMRIKLSPEKGTYPGPKQVWRCTNGSGKYAKDVVSLDEEEAPKSEGGTDESWRKLLAPVMVKGLPLRPDTPSDKPSVVATRDYRLAHLDSARRRAQEERRRLPDALLDFDPTNHPYSITFSERLRHERQRLETELASRLHSTGQRP